MQKTSMKQSVIGASAPSIAEAGMAVLSKLGKFGWQLVCDLFPEMIHSCLHQLAMMSLLPRWWSWKCRDWSLWLPTGLSTAPWRWRGARSSRLTRQRHPNQRERFSLHPTAKRKKKKKRRRFLKISLLFLKHCIKFMSTQVFFCKAKLMYPIKILIFSHPILAVLCSARCKWALQRMYRLFWGPNVFPDAFNSRAISWRKYERGTWLKREIRGEQSEGNEGVCGCVCSGGGWEHKLHVLMYMWLLFAFTNCLYLVKRK